MFRSSTILRELVQSLAKATHRSVSSMTPAGRVCTTNSTHAISGHAATSPHNIQRHNSTECINRSIALARLYTSSLRMVEDRNM